MSEALMQDQRTQRTRTKIIVRIGKNKKSIPIADVYFFQSDDKYTTVCYKEGITVICDTLISLEKEFWSILIRIHRNALVMKSYIEDLKFDKINNCWVTIKGTDEKLNVSRRCVHSLRQLIQSL